MTVPSHTSFSTKTALSASFSRCMTYSAPNLAISWLVAPLAIVQGIYAKYHGLSLTAIAAIILIARLFDTVSDPVVGHYSDRFHRRTGTRKPFVLVGGLLTILCGYFLYVPPPQVTLVYFAVWLFMFYLSWTLFEVAHIAWASELADTAQSKTLIYSYRNISTYGGQALFYITPLLPFLETRDITPETMWISAIAAGIFILPTLFYCLKFTPDSYRASPVNQSCKLHTEWHEFLRFLLSNRAYLIFIAAFLCKTFSAGMWYGLIFIYVDAYLGMGNQFSQMFLIAFAVGIMATPMWYRVANWIGKKNTWLLSMVLLIISFIYTAFLKPGSTGFTELLGLKITQTLGFSCMGVVAPAILSEIIDYSTWKEGCERTATYFSLYTFTSKVSAAIGTALGLGIAGWFGFDATATLHGKESIWGLILAISWLPLIFASLGLFFIALTPINEHRHAIIRRRLDARVIS